MESISDDKSIMEVELKSQTKAFYYQNFSWNKHSQIYLVREQFVRSDKYENQIKYFVLGKILFIVLA